MANKVLVSSDLSTAHCAALIKRPMINKVLEASTGHVHREDEALLHLDNTSLGAYIYKWGLFVCPLGDVFDDHGPILASTGLREEGLSEEFIRLLGFAREHDCMYLQLDADGQVYNDLPKIDWPDNIAFEEMLLVTRTEFIELPLLMDRVKTKEGQRLLEERIKLREQWKNIALQRLVKEGYNIPKN